MTDKELAVLGQLTPQDYLQFMQEVWAEVIVLAPKYHELEFLLEIFNYELTLLEWCVVGNKNQIFPNHSQEGDLTLEAIRLAMDEAYLQLIEVLREKTKEL